MPGTSPPRLTLELHCETGVANKSGISVSKRNIAVSLMPGYIRNMARAVPMTESIITMSCLKC